MKLNELKKRTAEPQNVEYRTAECRRMESLCSVFFKIDRSTKSSRQAEFITSTFDIHYSTFDIRFFRISFIDQIDRSAVSGSTDT